MRRRTAPVTIAGFAAAMASEPTEALRASAVGASAGGAATSGGAAPSEAAGGAAGGAAQT